MRRLGSLHHHHPPFAAPPRPAGDLFEHIECSFSRAEIREIDQRIGVKNTHKTHSIEIKTLCHHLGTHKNIGFPLGKIGYNVLIAVLVACGVEIHAQSLRLLESGFNDILYALRAIAMHLDRRLFASRAYRGQAVGGAAIMAHHLSGSAVISERHVAILAFWHKSALTAQHHRSETATVMEKYKLLLLSKTFTRQLSQRK